MQKTKIKTLDDYRTANKKYCKTYYDKKKNQIKIQKDKLLKLKQENDQLKQKNALFIKELNEIKEKLDKELESEDEDDDDDDDDEDEDDDDEDEDDDDDDENEDEEVSYYNPYHFI